MSRCALRRWGSGVTCTKEPDTAASREMGEKLAAMRAERERQDTMWGGTSSSLPGGAQASPQPPVQGVPTDTSNTYNAKGYTRPYTGNTSYQR